MAAECADAKGEEAQARHAECVRWLKTMEARDHLLSYNALRKKT